MDYFEYTDVTKRKQKRNPIGRENGPSSLLHILNEVDVAKCATNYKKNNCQLVSLISVAQVVASNRMILSSVLA